jgi:NAD(P)-dependent dehydrogenase (short-subunit alcohol dehydrogenase family)
MIEQGRGGRIIGTPPIPISIFASLIAAHFWLRTFFHSGACSGTGKQAKASLSAYSASKFAIRGLTQSAGA